LEATFNPADYPDLLVGLQAPDDAAIWRLGEGRVLIATTDFFTPVVDDAYDYGAIAAANSLSDIYAMGGTPFLALNIAALPPDLPVEISTEILRGGAETVRSAGAIIAGGHTIQDKEPKYGLVVLGFAEECSLLTKSGARSGDHLVLTKPLGFGVTTTALKRELADADDVAEAVGWMKRLNREASALAVEFGLHGATDITGYSLLGHGLEMAQASGVGFRLEYAHIPFISCARRYAEAWTFPGGAADNRLHFGSGVRFADSLDEAAQMLLFDPQTSGGLLLAVPPEKMSDFLSSAAQRSQPAWEIGIITDTPGIEVV
jgi:selenide, water dikinase